jgi:hypothetical protein
MADIAITIKLTAEEFQTLRTELRAHAASLEAGRLQAKEARNFSDANALLTRSSRVASLLEVLA